MIMKITKKKAIKKARIQNTHLPTPSTSTSKSTPTEYQFRFAISLYIYIMHLQSDLLVVAVTNDTYNRGASTSGTRYELSSNLSRGLEVTNDIFIYLFRGGQFMYRAKKTKKQLVPWFVSSYGVVHMSTVNSHVNTNFSFTNRSRRFGRTIFNNKLCHMASLSLISELKNKISRYETLFDEAILAGNEKKELMFFDLISKSRETLNSCLLKNKVKRILSSLNLKDIYFVICLHIHIYVYRHHTKLHR
jgi:hypothetical protein